MAAKDRVHSLSEDKISGGTRVAKWSLICAVAALIFSIYVLVSISKDKVSDRVSALRTPLETAAVLVLSDPSASRDEVTTVLANRLRTAGIPHRILPVESDKLEVQFTARDTPDADEVLGLILRPAVLAFRLVHRNNEQLIPKLFQQEIAPPGFTILSVNGQDYYRHDSGNIPPDDFAEQIAATGEISPLYKLVLERTYVGGFTEPLFLPHYVNRRTMLDGSLVKSAKPQTDHFGRFEIALTFSAAGAKEFTELTRNYAARGPENPSDWGRQLAI
ncbi:MAG: hypothetical protein LAT79_15285, partial [Kiritimatiellae bacterium]|nr:hypothetical protein [Kiritimatiellia bacterium]